MCYLEKYRIYRSLPNMHVHVYEHVYIHILPLIILDGS